MTDRIIPPRSRWKRTNVEGGVSYTVQHVGGGFVTLESDAGDRERVHVRQFFHRWDRVNNEQEK